MTGTHFILLTDGISNKVSSLTIEQWFEKSEVEGFFIDTILLSDTADGKKTLPLGIRDGRW